ncbi:hypothetical protein PV327_009487 [Microctonus hyperodae]|uniref:Pre-mRNA-splicing regulator female-lethal(2)D n=1 Tax=Microctonus hyperodae TaxID=165561 RepID=A0AA39FUC6_MICHY|nr:hypothetical protein PV327_009487 [Microctonus hyperodae]
MAEESIETKSVGQSSPRSPSDAINKTATSPKSPKQLRRVKLTDQQLESITKEELATKWREQDLYVECLETQATAQEGEITNLKESEEKYRQQYSEATHREKILVRRLASKEQELQEYVNQITEMKAAQTPSATSLRSALLDPAINILIQKLRQELITTKAKLEDTQNELSAWKFTPDSNTGKRLMAKCRLLYQENEELGRMIASGRIAKLEGELALQKTFSEEVKKSQSELDEFLQDLDEDVEGMQSTIYFLQQELRKARESVTLLQQENFSLKSNNINENNISNGLSPHTPPMKKETEEHDGTTTSSTVTNENTKGLLITMARDIEDGKSGARTPPLPASLSRISSDVNNDCEKIIDDNKHNKQISIDNIDDSSSDSAALIIKVENEELSDRDDDDEDDQRDNNGEDDDEDDNKIDGRRTLRTKGDNGKNCNRGNIVIDSDGGCNSKLNGEESSRTIARVRDRTKRDKSVPSGSDDECMHNKKKRRESILSIDYNEDDALVLTNGETLQSDPE